MIKLTAEQVETLEDLGFRQHFDEQDWPWFKIFPTDEEGMDFEIIVNPLHSDANILVGCSGRADGGFGLEVNSYIDVKDVFGILAVLKSVDIW